MSEQEDTNASEFFARPKTTTEKKEPKLNLAENCHYQLLEVASESKLPTNEIVGILEVVKQEIMLSAYEDSYKDSQH